MANGKRYDVDRNQRGVDDAVLSDVTSAEFQAGPIPHRITRRFFANDEGLNGEDTNYYPNTGGMAFMPHQMTPRSPRSRAGRNGVPTINETLAVPSYGAGDAV